MKRYFGANGLITKSIFSHTRALCCLSALMFGPLSLNGWAANNPPDDPNEKLLSLMNHVRSKSGLTPLKHDTRIDDAAALHLGEFVKNRQILDQFEGEPTLLERLRMAQVSAGAAGEIMLQAKQLDQVTELLKREDFQKALLNPAYTLVGIAQIESGTELFIVADLVRPLQSLSPDEVENLVAESLQQSRINAKLMRFKIVRLPQLHGLACDMAKKDSLEAEPINPYMGYVGAPSKDVRNFTFTTFDPGALPRSIQNAGDDPKINTASVGVCFAPSKTYPNGTYWVAIVLYGAGALQR